MHIYMRKVNVCGIGFLGGGIWSHVIHQVPAKRASSPIQSIILIFKYSIRLGIEISIQMMHL